MSEQIGGQRVHLGGDIPVADPAASPGAPGHPQGDGVSATLPPRSRGVIGLAPEKCTSCMICVRECPAWCIHIDAHPEQDEPGDGAGGSGGTGARGPRQARGRVRSHNVLDRFAIDYGLCMYCGICVEVCPFDALAWNPEYDYAAAEPSGLVQEKEQLAAWWPAGSRGDGTNGEDAGSGLERHQIQSGASLDDRERP